MKVKAKSSSLPGAWIVRPSDKGRKPIKLGNIYLDHQEEFQIELFNPLKKSVLADIKLNSQSISKNGLILKPGQRIYLDCFIDDKKKFIFSTYQVENTTESIEAIEDNGSMEVSFYEEESVIFNNLNGTVIIKDYYPIYIDRYHPPYYWNNYPVYSSDTAKIGTSINNVTYSSSVNCINTSKSFFSDNIETGRVEKGEKSDQKFTEVDMNFEKNCISHVVYKLLPSSRKPIEISTKKSNFNSTESIIDLIKGLNDLKVSGIITEEQFEEKKKVLLERI